MPDPDRGLAGHSAVSHERLPHPSKRRMQICAFHPTCCGRSDPSGRIGRHEAKEGSHAMPFFDVFLEIDGIKGETADKQSSKVQLDPVLQEAAQTLAAAQVKAAEDGPRLTSTVVVTEDENTAARTQERLHIEDFGSCVTQQGSMAGSGFDGRFLAAEDLKAEQATRAEIEIHNFTWGATQQSAAGGSHDRWIDLEPIGPIIKAGGRSSSAAENEDGSPGGDFLGGVFVGGDAIFGGDHGGPWKTTNFDW
jgi:hypothetical protein